MPFLLALLRNFLAAVTEIPSIFMLCECEEMLTIICPLLTVGYTVFVANKSSHYSSAILTVARSTVLLMKCGGFHSYGRKCWAESQSLGSWFS